MAPVLHICGNTLDRIGYICESGFDAFHFDSKVDAKDAVNEVDGRISLMGNVNNPEILLDGTPDQVAEQTRYAMEAGVQVIGPECAIPRQRDRRVGPGEDEDGHGELPDRPSG